MKDKYPWSILVQVLKVPESGENRVLEANVEQRAGIAELGRILAVTDLKADVTMVPVGGRNIKVSGRLKAVVEQACVVTLEPVVSVIDEPIEQLYAPASQIKEMAALIDDNAEEGEDETEDPPEPIQNGFIDIGHLIVDTMFLALDPYPRKEGAVYQPVVEKSVGENNPFAALQQLKEPE